MVNCPNCKKELAKPAKKWKYGHFIAEAYRCEKCGTRFNEYTSNGKHSFTLKLATANRYVKV
ncbi:ZPR1-type zinc finger protein [Candidatus Bathyarchaeota archaeon]|nr:ZPR1-type zinc finger protein [Candidatus Bathyarchaeota archaeon]